MRSISRRSLALIAFMTLLAAPGRVAAQADVPGELKELYDVAVKEGAGLRIYSQIVPTTLETLAVQWAKRFPGVKLEYVRLGTGPMIERVNAELAAGKPGADVVMVSDSVWVEDLLKAGKIAEYKIDAYKLWPAEYKRDNYFFVGQLYLTAMFYNTTKVKGGDIPKTYADLIKFGKRANLADPRAGGGGSTFMFGTMAMFGDGYWKKAAEARVQYAASVAEVTPKVVSGDIYVGVHAHSLPACQEAEGRPIKTIYPAEGSWSTPALTFGPKGVARPRAAELFIAYIMSEEGQTFINTADCTYSVRPGVKLNAALPALSSIKVINISPEEWRKHGEVYRKAAARAGGIPID